MLDLDLPPGTRLRVTHHLQTDQQKQALLDQAWCAGKTETEILTACRAIVRPCEGTYMIAYYILDAFIPDALFKGGYGVKIKGWSQIFARECFSVVQDED